MHATIKDAVRWLAGVRRMVVLTGAGVSKESGIPTFREAGEGLWAQYDPMEMASREGFLRNPGLVWSWYEHRFGMVSSAEPNAGHRAIVDLEQLFPSVIVVTQNIDGLHRAAGSTRIVELHGNIRRFKCLSGRHTDFSLADFAGQDEKPPLCPNCGDIIRPDVVWFGEYLPEKVVQEAYEACLQCEAMLVVGTSGVVQPAASLPRLAARAGAMVIDVNPEQDEIAMTADLFLKGKGGKMLPQLVAALQAQR